MIVTCDGCETSFHVQDYKIKPTGSKVRCSKCRHVFITYPTETLEPEETLILQETVPEAPEQSARLKEIDFNIDDLAGEEVAVNSAAPLSELEPEFLNVADLLDGEDSETGELASEPLEDDLQFDLDFGLSLEAAMPEETDEAKTPPEAPVSPEETSVDFNLATAFESPTVQAEPLPAADELEINLGDLDLMKETGATEATEAGPKEDILGDKLELGLDLEALLSESSGAVSRHPAGPDTLTSVRHVNTREEEKPAPADRAKGEAEFELDLPLNESTFQPSEDAQPSSAGEDELDLSDLEAMLEDVEKETESGLVASAGTESELDIQTVVPDKTAGAEMQGLDLTAIATPSEKTDVSAEAETEALDFTDLAGILDEKAPAAGLADRKAAVEEAGLAFEEQPTPMENGVAEAKAPSSIEEGLMLDLDKLLEEDDEAKAGIPEIQATAADELDLSLEHEPMRDSAGELEIEPLAEGDEIAADQLSASTSAATAAAAATTAVMAVAAAPATATSNGFASSTATAVLEPEEEKTPPATKQGTQAAERSGGIRKLLLAAAAIGVLALAALVIPRGLGIHVPALRDLEIPFLGKIFQPEPEDTIGNLKVMVVQESISAEFIENARVGKICVIKGQVRNNYDHPRSSIRVTGKLYDKNKSVVKMTTVFAGNMIPRDELAGQGMGVISSHLKNKDGVNQQNVGVKPGASIPFMIVFDGLPDNLDEYSVEVAGSSAG